jgi:hypothetical protein
MRVGFYKNELVDPVAFYDIDDADVIEEVAKGFAEQEHQIDEASDMEFTVYVEDANGKIHAVNFFTEYDPRFEVEAVNELDP